MTEHKKALAFIKTGIPQFASIIIPLHHCSQEHAIFVCIVMDYYQLGDLEKALRQRRSKGTSLEPQVLYKWLGQMVEALHYVHDQQMIHR